MDRVVVERPKTDACSSCTSQDTCTSRSRVTQVAEVTIVRKIATRPAGGRHAGVV